MSAPDQGSVTGLQLDVLRALWSAGEATVAQVQQFLSERRELAPTTVATLLGRLEKRDLVDHRREGRQFLYRALVLEQDVIQRAVDEVTEQVFEGDIAAFATRLLSAKDIKAGDLARVRALIEARMTELSED
ncbi:MAG: BlaI family penicillinase repressor [Planctomycetota bacterium]|jgi:BlaI family penicillinase repressor